MGGGDRSGMIDQGCVKPLGIPPLGVHTALRGEKLVFSGTPLEEGTSPHRRILGEEKPHCYSPEAKYDFKPLIMLFAKGTRFKIPE